jgi:nitrogen fixation-related uncharacterized protein
MNCPAPEQWGINHGNTYLIAASRGELNPERLKEVGSARCVGMSLFFWGKTLSFPDLKPVKHNFLADGKEARMAKIRKRKVRWNPSNAAGVVGYRLYWAVGEEADYESEFADIGNVTEVILPDEVPSFPTVAGDIELGVTAVDHIGNESDMAKFSAPFDFTAPDAPTDLVVETI